jgi:hypothetical protein
MKKCYFRRYVPMSTSKLPTVFKMTENVDILTVGNLDVDKRTNIRKFYLHMYCRWLLRRGPILQQREDLLDVPSVLLEETEAIFATESGLPDGLFSNQNSQIWVNFGWEMLVYFITVRNILWPFGLIYGRLV